MKGFYTTLILLIFVMLQIHVYAQELLPVDKSEFVQKKAERKAVYLKIKEANKLYNSGLGYVTESLGLMLEAYDVNPENPQLNYNIGICYLIDGPKIKALPYLLKVDSLQENLSRDVHFFIGMVYQYQNEFSQAIVHFKMNLELIQQNHEKNTQDLVELCLKHIEECRNGKLLLDEQNISKVELLSNKVNTKFDEFNPYQYAGNLYFSSRRGIEGQDQRSVRDSKFYEKIYKVSLSDKLADKSIVVDNKFDKKSNYAFLSKYMNDRFVVYSDNSGNGDFFFAEKRKDKWKYIEPITFINEESSRESSACFTDDGKEVYFVSDRKGGFGECDIYYCSLNKKGKWSKPINIGGQINTEYDEGDVFVSSDGMELYFSSKGHNTMGGYDIFKCERNANKTWGMPVNMGFPINSTDNDITYFKDKSGVFYFASERGGGFGGFDIYRQKVKPEIVEEKKALVVKDAKPVEKKEMAIVAPIALAPSLSLIKIENTDRQELANEDFIYRVQIAACRREMSSVDLYNRYKGGAIIEHLYVEGWHRYTIGKFDNYEEAAKYKAACGVSDGFVVLFKGGYRIGYTHKPSVVK